MSIQQNKKKVAGLDALKNLSSPKTEPLLAEKEEKPKDPTPKNKKTIFSLHLPSEVHEQLRELGFHERTSMTKLLLEGADLLFKKRGLPTSKELHKEVDM